MLVWAGDDNNANVDKSYSKAIKNIWLDTVEFYESNKDPDTSWYTMPDNVVAIPMDPISGKYDQTAKTLFYFIDGTHLAYLSNKKNQE